MAIPLLLALTVLTWTIAQAQAPTNDSLRRTQYVSTRSWRDACFQISDNVRGDFNGQIVIDFDVTPSKNGIDGVMGFADSGVEPEGFRDLPITMRMWQNGRWEVRDGHRYTSDQPLRYQAGSTYRVRLLAGLDDERHSVWITPPGSSQAVEVADFFKFRSDARDKFIRNLRTFCVWSRAEGDFRVQRLVEGLRYYLQSHERWGRDSSCMEVWYGEQDQLRRLSFDAWPAHDKIDGVIALGDLGIARPSQFRHFAALVRMNTEGYFDARDGDGYRSDAKVPYSKGMGYRVAIRFNLRRRTYSVWVRPLAGGAKRVRIADRYAFRANAADTDNLKRMCLKSPRGRAREFYITRLPHGPL